MADCHAVSLDHIFTEVVAILHALLWAFTQLVTPLCIYYDCVAPAEDAQGLSQAPQGLEGVVNVIRAVIRIYESKGGSGCIWAC